MLENRSFDHIFRGKNMEWPKVCRISQTPWSKAYDRKHFGSCAFVFLYDRIVLVIYRSELILHVQKQYDLTFLAYFICTKNHTIVDFWHYNSLTCYHVLLGP